MALLSIDLRALFTLHVPRDSRNLSPFTDPRIEHLLWLLSLAKPDKRMTMSPQMPDSAFYS